MRSLTDLVYLLISVDVKSMLPSRLKWCLYLVIMFTQQPLTSSQQTANDKLHSFNSIMTPDNWQPTAYINKCNKRAAAYHHRYERHCYQYTGYNVKLLQ